jgi:hypothetical protein
VPQGATLSPLLFCIYLNDLPSVSRDSNLESYVDDSKVLLSFPLRQIDAAIINLEQDLHRVASWCCENHLLINPGKTKYMMIGTRQLMSRLPTDTSVSFLGKSLIKPVDSAKDLGVTLDRHLNYDKHVSLLVSSCMNKLCQINRAKNSFDTKTLSEVISSLVISKMVYCSSVWSNTSASNVKKVQSIQNFACKIITKSKYDHVTPLLRQLNWLPCSRQTTIF